jgi:hypothetical protein
MLMYILLGILSTVSAESFSRSYLRDMKRVEEERNNRLQINGAVNNIKQLIFQAAKNGLTEISSEPFEGCKYSRDSQISLEACEYIVSEIKSEIIQMFPDSDLSYNDKTKKYTLKWD